MPERPFESSPEVSLADAQSRRKKMMEKLADSPWKWALMAVMALESQACSSLPRQVGWMGLEPNAGSMDYDVKYGQQGTGQDYVAGNAHEAVVVDAMRGLQREQEGPEMPLSQSTTYIGPRGYIEFSPRNAKPTISQIPEGFDGKNPQGIFAVAHGTPLDPMRRIADPRLSDSARLDSVMRTKERLEDVLAERQAVADRAINLLLPQLPDRNLGIRLEWQDVQSLDPEHGRRLTISCRAAPWASPSREPSNIRPTIGHMLEHEVLSDDQTVWAALDGNGLYFSTTERSERHPQSPAQAVCLSRPVNLKNWNHISTQIADLKKELETLPKSEEETQVQGPQIVRLRERAALLKKDIADLTRRLDHAYDRARMDGIDSTLAKFLPLIKDNEIRFYVRFEEKTESLQVIAVIDDPDISNL